MLKNILKLEGVQELSAEDQKAINGGQAAGPYWCDAELTQYCAAAHCCEWNGTAWTCKNIRGC